LHSTIGLESSTKRLDVGITHRKTDTHSGGEVPRLESSGIELHQ
jgi:hypothetical protein